MNVTSALKTDGPSLFLSICLVPWDSDVFGFPVAQIDSLTIHDATKAKVEFQQVRRWLQEQKVRLVSCRLQHQKLAESFFLEDEGFRFVEMVLHPHTKQLNNLTVDESGLAVAPAVETDLPALTAIAETTFGSERFHVDPRVNLDLANLRYGNWVKSCLTHPQQVLLKVSNGHEIVALFIVESLASGIVYWHLTAVAAHLQGKGIGLMAWQAMMHYHHSEGAKGIQTTISARNTRVLNLYSRLGFRFLPPDMTFHYVL